MSVAHHNSTHNPQPTPTEANIIQRVKQGIASDQNRSPWSNDRWYMTFNKNNQDGVTLAKAPKNTLLMVVTESVGTLYVHRLGTQIMRGSVLMKLEDNLVVCLDAYCWGITASKGTVISKRNGIYTFDERNLHGKVKPVAQVNA